MIRVFLLFFVALFSGVHAEETVEKFRVIDVYVEVPDQVNLCVYQAQIHFDPKNIKIISIESGEAEYFSDAPIYDFKSGEESILSIGSFRKKYEKGTPKKFKLFRLHVMMRGDDTSVIQIKKMIFADENGLAVKGLLTPKLLEGKK